MFDLFAIPLLFLVYAKGTRVLFAWRDREQKWRDADALQRERIVRDECAWRVIGRIAGAGALVTGAFIIPFSVPAVIWVVAAWRVVKPIAQELSDACSYRSTGANNETPYSW